ncbi:MAG TPA: hypothetical protein VEB19_00100, partial [Gemmatimonadaceae bacterium]|nr:hypothetical protein [Gemmatimonadaceae bacterium]
MRERLSAFSSQLSAISSWLCAISLAVAAISCTGGAGEEDRADTADSGARSAPVAEDLGADSNATSAADPNCGAAQPPVLTDSGVGLLRIGARVASIASRCMVLSDTTLEHGTEGQPERRLTVTVAGLSTVATVVDDRIWRIQIDSPAFRTSDS